MPNSSSKNEQELVQRHFKNESNVGGITPKQDHYKLTSSLSSTALHHLHIAAQQHTTQQHIIPTLQQCSK